MDDGQQVPTVETDSDATPNLLYIATVGNDSLPVMAGLAWVRHQWPEHRIGVLLLEDAPDDQRWAGQRTRLRQWLSKHSASVHTVSPDELPAHLTAGVRAVANVTGGRKPLAFAVAAAVQGADGQVVVIDAHAAQMPVQVRDIGGAAQWPVPPMSLSDVLSIYVAEATPKKAPLSGLSANWLRLFQAWASRLELASPTVWTWRGNDFAVSLEGTILNILWLPSNPDFLRSQSQLRMFRQRLQELGGQLARGYLPPDLIDPEQQRAYAQGLGLTVLSESDQTSPPAPVAALPSPPTLESVDRTLVIMLGEQVMPTVLEFFRLQHAGPDRIVLLRGEQPRLRATTGRLRHWLARQAPAAEVRVIDVSSRNPEGVGQVLEQVLQASAHSVVNLTGGTKLMGLSALRVALNFPDTELTYTDGKTTLDIRSGLPLTERAAVPLGAAELLALHGIRLERHRPLRADQHLGQLARIAAPDSAAAQDIRAFQQRWHLTQPQPHPPLSDRGYVRGLAHEYLVWLAAHTAFPEAEVLSGVQLHALTWTEDGQADQTTALSRANPQAAQKEVDVLVARDGELLVIEVKSSLETAFRGQNQEHLDTGQFGLDLGRFARVAIVGMTTFRVRPPAVPDSQTRPPPISHEALSRAGRKQTYWVSLEEKLPLLDGVQALNRLAQIFDT
jgi:hypothetical protein